MKVLSGKWSIRRNETLLQEIGDYLDKFYVSADLAINKRHYPENDLAQYYLDINVEPLHKSINEKLDSIHEILDGIPSSNITKNYSSPFTDLKMCVIRSCMALRGFLKDANEKYENEFKTTIALHNIGLNTLLEISNNVDGIIPKLIIEIMHEDEQMINHLKKVIEIRKDKDYRLDLKYLRENLAPLFVFIQERIDLLGENMSKLLEEDTQITLELQQSIWLVASIAIGISTITGLFLLIFNLKYVILYWPRKTFVSSRI